MGACLLASRSHVMLLLLQERNRSRALLRVHSLYSKRLPEAEEADKALGEALSDFNKITKGSFMFSSRIWVILRPTVTCCRSQTGNISAKFCGESPAFERLVRSTIISQQRSCGPTCVECRHHNASRTFQSRTRFGAIRIGPRSSAETHF
jgi:hypothetical protein